MTTSQTIWIVRHGTREDFFDPAWASKAPRPHDPGLTDHGLRQAQEVGLRMIGQPVDGIYASPFLRTIQTASQIAEALKLPVRLEAGLGESLPHLSGPPQIVDPHRERERFPRLDLSYRSIHTPTFPEPDAQAMQRTGETIQRIADQQPDANLLFVSHASPIAGAVRYLLKSRDRVQVPLCAVFTLTRNGQGWSLQEAADISHLSDPQTSLRYAWTC